MFVDDEEMVLLTLKSFFELETDYDVHTFLTVRDALHFVKNNRVDLIVSDYLMPYMDGMDFLKKFSRI